MLRSLFHSLKGIPNYYHSGPYTVQDSKYNNLLFQYIRKPLLVGNQFEPVTVGEQILVTIAVEPQDDVARYSIRHVYYDDSQEDIKSLKEYLKNGQEVSTLFYKNQMTVI